MIDDKAFQRNSIAIWESTQHIAGGTRVSFSIYELLKNRCRCVFILPAEGAVSNILQNRGIPYVVIKQGNYNNQKKNFRDVFVFVLFLFPGLLRLYRAIRKYRVRLIYSNAVRSCVLTALAGSLFDIPVVWHIHHYFSDKKAIQLLNWCGRLSCIRKIVFVSDFVRRQFQFLSNKSIVIYNGVDTASLRRERDNSPYDLRARLKIPSDYKIVSLIANILEAKEQHVLIKAIPNIINRYSKVHFVLVGSWEDDAYGSYLMQIAVETGVSAYLSCLGFCDDIPGLLRSVTINAVTSIEGCPMALLECAVLGVPAVVPDVGGSLELVRQGNVGLIYSYQDCEDLARKILELLTKRGLYEDFRKECQKWSKSVDIGKFNMKIRGIIDSEIGR